nr:class I SAM-dependent methyltransferase [Paenibacillus sp. SYP-B3998]
MDEVPRYSVVTGYLQSYRSNAAILDLGCGQGMLLKYMQYYERYLGVDFSEEALKLARSLTTERCTFIHSDIEVFTPDDRYDLIIFNECLYYFDHPLDLMERYKAFLRPDGAFIISLHVREASEIIRQNLIQSREYAILSDVQLTTDANSWTVSLIRPKA